MAVFVIPRTLDFKCSALTVGIDDQIVSSSTLCGCDCGDIELAKFQLCFDAKEILGALNEAILDG